MIMLPAALMNAHAQPSINTVEALNDTIGLYEKFLLDVGFSASYNNPFDRSQVMAGVIFRAPSGDSFNIPVIYIQDYQMAGPDSLVPSGTAVWQARFTPNEQGIWSYRVYLHDSNGSDTTPTAYFTCLGQGNDGFLRLDSNGYLVFDSGKRFFAVGENLAWGDPDSSFHCYFRWIDSLALYNANFMKLIMAPWSFGLEWGASNLRNYASRQGVAWYLDTILDYAWQKGIYTQIDFVIHDEWMESTSHWNDNPYNAANGGPCVVPIAFFSDSVAWGHFTNRLDYILGRWAHHPGIAAWEIISEGDKVDGYNQHKPEVRNWILQCAAWLEAGDPNRRPVTAGFANRVNDTILWKDSLISFTQSHLYEQKTDLEGSLYSRNLEFRNAWGKAVIIGEFGLSHDPDSIIANDPEGIAFHNSLWTTAMSGSFGCGLTWWWNNYIDPFSLYRHFNGPATLMQHFNPGGSRLARFTCATDSLTRLDILPGFLTVLARSPASAFTVERGGYMYPAANYLGSLLYGSGLLVAGFRNPPVFAADYAEDGTFSVRTGGNVTGSVLKISIDGNTALQANTLPDTAYTVSVGAGMHSIQVDNASSGNNVLEVRAFSFGGYASLLRNFSLMTDTSAAGWVHNRAYNWLDVKNSGIPAAVVNAGMQVAGLQDGAYLVEFRDCVSAAADTIFKAVSVGGTMNVPLPAIATDISFLIRPGTSPGMDEDGRPASFLNAFPNPFSTHTSVIVPIGPLLPASIKIYDLSGRVVRIFPICHSADGSNVFTWRGDNGQGDPVPPGMYILVVEAGEHRFQSKVIRQ